MNILRNITHRLYRIKHCSSSRSEQRRGLSGNYSAVRQLDRDRLRMIRIGDGLALFERSAYYRTLIDRNAGSLHNKLKLFDRCGTSPAAAAVAHSAEIATDDLVL